MRRFAEFTATRRYYEEVLEPTLSDMQVECFEALAARRPYKARWVQVRGYAIFWLTLLRGVPRWLVSFFLRLT